MYVVSSAKFCKFSETITLTLFEDFKQSRNFKSNKMLLVSKLPLNK